MEIPISVLFAFAGNPLFIDLAALREQGLLSAEDLSAACGLPEASVEYQRVIEFKYPLLRKAALAFLRSPHPIVGLRIVLPHNQQWLDDYALFMACKGVNKQCRLGALEPEIRQRQAEAIKKWQEQLSADVQFHKFAQYEFFQQWQDLKTLLRSI